MNPLEWPFYTYALGYLAGRSGQSDQAQYLISDPQIWRAGYETGKKDGVTHPRIEQPVTPSQDHQS